MINEEMIVKYIQELQGQCSSVGVFCIKLDDFSAIHNYLQESEESVVRYVIDGLQELLGEQANIFHHEENCVVLCVPLETQDESHRFADVIHQHLISKSMRSVKEEDFYISASTGVSLYPLHSENATEVLRKAKTAVAFAGKLGRNSYRFYEESMDRVVLDKLKLESALHKALERNELVLHYQPKVDIHNDALIGVEALVRWNSLEFCLVPPLKFIPLAEENGLIIPIGNWILNTACTQIHEFNQRNNKSVSVAVNVSTRQFINNDMVESVKRALTESKLPPDLLELEITETALVQNNEPILKALEKIRDMGIKVSIDDFGTGYSSLSNLKEYPVDTLKIDRSFIQNLTDGIKNLEIVSTIISLGHSLQLKVVAEGVETPGQLAALRKCRCDIIQGYLVSKPMPIEDFDVYIH